MAICTLHIRTRAQLRRPRLLQPQVAKVAAAAARTPLSAKTAGHSRGPRTPYSDPGPKDRVLSQIRAYSRLRPADRRALLTEQGSRDRLRANKITLRQSMAHLPMPRMLAGEPAAHS